MKVALIFPGYMSQYVGMGKDLYDEYRIVQEYFEEASSCANINFVKLCFASSDAELSRVAHAYMSLFLIGACVFAVLKEVGIVPSIVAGYNNGEVTGLFAGGCFSLPDGLYLLNKFCSFYQEYLDQADSAVAKISGKTSQELQRMCNELHRSDQVIDIGFFNGEKDHIVVGSKDAVALLDNQLESETGVKFDYLAPEMGTHTQKILPVVDQFKIYLEKVDFKDVTIPFISGIDGQTVANGQEIKQRFVSHFVSPFHFNAILAALHAYDVIIISSPSKQLVDVIRNYYPDKDIVTIEKKADVEALAQRLHTV